MKKIVVAAVGLFLVAAGIIAIVFAGKQPAITIIHGKQTVCQWCGKIIEDSTKQEKRWGWPPRKEYSEKEHFYRSVECDNCTEKVVNYEVYICKNSGVPYRRVAVKHPRHQKKEGKTIAKVNGQYLKPSETWFVIPPGKEKGSPVKIVLRKTGGEMQSKLGFNKIALGEYIFYLREPYSAGGYYWSEEVKANAEDLINRRDAYLSGKLGKAYTPDVAKAMLECAAGNIAFREDAPRASFNYGEKSITIWPHRELRKNSMGKHFWTEMDFCKWDVEVVGPNEEGKMLQETKRFWVEDGKYLPKVWYLTPKLIHRYGTAIDYMFNPKLPPPWYEDRPECWETQNYPHYFFRGQYVPPGLLGTIYAIIINDYILKTGWQTPSEPLVPFLEVFFCQRTQKVYRIEELKGPKSLVESLLPLWEKDFINSFQSKGRISPQMADTIRSYEKSYVLENQEGYSAEGLALMEQERKTWEGRLMQWYRALEDIDRRISNSRLVQRVGDAMMGCLIENVPKYVGKRNPWGIPGGEALFLQWALGEAPPGEKQIPFPENWYKK